jgi:uncharacterized protein YggL (DUF469 family)
MSDRFKVFLDFREGVTVGDRNALLDQFMLEVIAPAELDREELVLSQGQVKAVYRFRRQLTADEMHDVCRAIFRWVRSKGARAVAGVGISDRSWWKPVYAPGQPDPVDPLDPAAP